MSQQYRCQVIIQSDCMGLQRTNQPCDNFTYFDNYFQLDFYETSFLCNESKIKVVGCNIIPRYKKIALTLDFQ